MRRKPKIHDRGRPADGAGRRATLAIAAIALAPGVNAGFSAVTAPRDAQAPDLSSYAAIDAALEGEVLLPLGATWRYFRGVAEPSPGLEWTEPGFDDHEWKEGPTPIGFGHDDNATRLDGLEPPVTTVYLRGVLNVPGADRFAEIHAEMPIDDGFVFYLDGKEEDRLHTGLPDERQAFDATSTWRRTLDLGPLPRIDLTEKLTPGDHLIAIQGLVHAKDADTMSIRPVVRGTYVEDAAADEERVERFRSALTAAVAKDEPGAEARLAYLEGRDRQRKGEQAAAAPSFLRASELDPAAPAPLERLVECHRATGTLAELETELRARVGAGATTTLLDAWARVYLEDQGGSPADLPALVPDGADLADAGFFADAFWSGSESLAGHPLRIDCGGDKDHGTNGAFWSHDRFARQGHPEPWSGDGVPFESVRLCTRRSDDLASIYHVALPDGLYGLRVHLVSDGPELFDLFAEGARVLTELDPTSEAAGVARTMPVRITDGFLDLDVFPRTKADGRIAGIEIEPLELERFESLARAWAEDTSWHVAFPIVQLAEARALAGELVEAIDFMEQAAGLPGFLPADRERLSALHDQHLPELFSYAAADDLVARGVERAAELLPAIQARARSGAPRSRAEAREDGPVARATYLEARIHQVEGRLDEATVEFERLAFSGRKEPEPLLRMAECLVASGLAPEAEVILREGLFDGVPATPAVLRLWISLGLDEVGRGEWDVVADLRELEVPDELVVVPTSEEAPIEWEYLEEDPPSTTWSRATFDASTWKRGPGGIGAGMPPGGVVRSLWSTDVLFARHGFTLPGRKLLYPHASAAVDDAGDVYLNGTLASRIHASTGGYVLLPLREGAFEKGQNYVGMYAIDYREPAYSDVGIIEPLGDLVWVLTELEEHGALRINCGGEDYVAADGTTWSGDRFFGYSLPSRVGDDVEIEGTDDDPLYRVQGAFGSTEIYTAWYQIPVPNGRYQVVLHFAELAEDALEKPRTFTVKLEKKKVLEDHDVAASVGLRTAEVQAFEVDVEDGWLDVDFAYKKHAFVSALEVLRLE